MEKEKKRLEYSKKLISDIRWLLWVVTVGGIALAFYCVYMHYTSSLPWVSAMVGLPWASHATVCSLYLNKSKAENTSADGEGIVYAKARAKGFSENYEENLEKYTNSTVLNSTELSAEEEVVDYIDSPPI